MLYYLFLSTIDVIIFYLVTYTLIQKRFEFSFTTKQSRKRLITTYGAGIIATLMITLTLYISGSQGYRLLSIVILILLIKTISKVMLRFAVAIYMITFIMLGIIQVPTFPLFILFGIDLASPQAFILGQIFSLISVVLICYKTKLHRVLWFLEENPKLKLSLFTLAGILLTSLFIINYEDALIYLLYYLLVLGLLVIAIIQVILGIGQRLKPEPRIDMKDTETIKKKLNSLIDKKRHLIKQDIILDRFNYISHHASITEPQLNELLELLLDHAISMQKDEPIIIGISVIYDQLQLIVKHECSQQAYQTLKKKRSIKNIQKVVRHHKGSTLLQRNYERIHQAYYAIIIVKI